MSPSETKLLINASGGDLAFARRLGLASKPNTIQRVNNWKRRGLPAAVERDYRDQIEQIMAEINQHTEHPSA